MQARRQTTFRSSAARPAHSPRRTCFLQSAVLLGATHALSRYDLHMTDRACFGRLSTYACLTLVLPIRWLYSWPSQRAHRLCTLDNPPTYYTRMSGPMHPYTFFPNPHARPSRHTFYGLVDFPYKCVWCDLYFVCVHVQSILFNSRFNFLYSGIIIILTIDWLPQLFLFLEKAFVVCQHYHKFHCVFLV